MLVVSAGLRTTQLPIASAGAIFHAQHQQREIPRDDLADDAERRDAAAGRDVVELVRPARVIEEMRRRHRHVEVARLLDRLAAVHRLGDGELARAILQQPRDAVEVFRALAAGHLAPDVVERALRRLVGGVDIGGAGERDLGELLLVGRVDGVEIFAGLRRDELAVDEKIVARLELRVGRLGRGIVFPQVAEDELGRGPAVAARRLRGKLGGHLSFIRTEFFERADSAWALA